MADMTIPLSNGNTLHITEAAAEPTEYEERDLSGAKVRRQSSDGAWSAWSRDGENRTETWYQADGTWWTATYNGRGDRLHYVNSAGTIHLSEFNEDGVCVREIEGTPAGIKFVEPTV